MDTIGTSKQDKDTIGTDASGVALSDLSALTADQLAEMLRAVALWADEPAALAELARRANLAADVEGEALARRVRR